MQLITMITSVAKLIAIGAMRTLSSTSGTTASSLKVLELWLTIGMVAILLEWWLYY